MRGMIRRTCVILCLLLLVPVLSVQAQGDMLGRINGLRASLGLPGYTLNGALSAAAQQHAQWMVDTGSISHTENDGSGPRSRAINAGYVSTDVSENIYGGTNATPDAAWTFWINSAIHYRGLTNARYKEVGIGTASSSWGTAYVLVFGNPGGPAYVPPSANDSGGTTSSAPPSYVLGVDEHGFILHEVQPDDTLGDIALIYGYTWADIPYMEAINGITDHYDLEIGSVFLVPPHDGTYTPTPADAAPEATATASPMPVVALILDASATPTMIPSRQPTLVAIAMAATSATMPEDLIIPQIPEAVIAAAPTEPVLVASRPRRAAHPRSGWSSHWWSRSGCCWPPGWNICAVRAGDPDAALSACLRHCLQTHAAWGNAAIAHGSLDH